MKKRSTTTTAAAATSSQTVKTAAAPKEKLPDSYWKEAFSKIVKYSKGIGYEVFITDGPDYVEIDDKEIYINRKSVPERKVYSILHELGHVAINENKQSFTATLGYVLRTFGKRSLTSKVTEIEEEYDAWKIGYKLGKYKKIKIDRREFETYKAICIKTYLSYALGIDPDKDKKKKNKVKAKKPAKRNVRLAKKKSTTTISGKRHVVKPGTNINQHHLKKSFAGKTNDDLFLNYFDNGKTDVTVRNELAVRNQPFVTHILNKYYSGSKLSYDSKQELIQEGYLGLLHAIEGFNPHLGFKFSTYASWWIKQSINNYLINVNPIIRVPNHIKAAQYKLMKQLKVENKSFTDLGDINPEDYNISKKMLGSINSAFKTKQVDSLNSPSYVGGVGAGETSTLEDKISSESFYDSEDNAAIVERNVDMDVLIDAFKEALEIMPEKRRMILLLRFGILDEQLLK